MRRIILYIPIVVSLCMFACSGGNQTTVSANGKFQLVDLPDGSQALLNKNSTISYDQSFTSREITQTGEVFYIVEKAGKSFTVNTDNGQVTVKGTEFNVKADEQNLEVEVEEGSVEMKVDKGVKLVSNGQKALFAVNGRGISVGKADFKYKKWKQALTKEARALGREVKGVSKKVGRQVSKESKKVGKEVSKESKKIGKDLNKGFKNIKKELK